MTICLFLPLFLGNQFYIGNSTYVSEAKTSNEEKIRYYQNVFELPLSYVWTEYLIINRKGYDISAGRDIVVFRHFGIKRKKMDNYSIFAEIQLPIMFECKIIFSDTNAIYKKEEVSLIPKYKSIPLINFEKGKMEYVESLLNDEIQCLISKFSSKVKEFYMQFDQNRITVSASYCPCEEIEIPMDKYYQDILSSIQECIDFIIALAEELTSSH